MNVQEVGWSFKFYEKNLAKYTVNDQVIKSRKMRFAGHAARFGKRGLCERFWWESQKEGDQ
jgi:hypothetical protein